MNALDDDVARLGKEDERHRGRLHQIENYNAAAAAADAARAALEATFGRRRAERLTLANAVIAAVAVAAAVVLHFT